MSNLRKWLGEARPSDFKSEDQIAEYFEEENLARLFPNEKIDPDEVDAAYHDCVREWQTSLELSDPVPDGVVEAMAKADAELTAEGL